MLTVGGLDDGLAKHGIDVAIGVEDIFDDPMDAAGFDSVKLWSHGGADVLEPMADGAGLLKDPRAMRGVGRGLAKRFHAGGDETRSLMGRLVLSTMLASG